MRNYFVRRLVNEFRLTSNASTRATTFPISSTGCSLLDFGHFVSVIVVCRHNAVRAIFSWHSRCVVGRSHFTWLNLSANKAHNRGSFPGQEAVCSMLHDKPS